MLICLSLRLGISNGERAEGNKGGNSSQAVSLPVSLPSSSSSSAWGVQPDHPPANLCYHGYGLSKLRNREGESHLLLDRKRSTCDRPGVCALLKGCWLHPGSISVFLKVKPWRRAGRREGHDQLDLWAAIRRQRERRSLALASSS